MKLSLCDDCIFIDANGWDEKLCGRPLPDPVPMSKLYGVLISPDDENHLCEGHFSQYPCHGCGNRDAGTRYCYLGEKL